MAREPVLNLEPDGAVYVRGYYSKQLTAERRKTDFAAGIAKLEAANIKPVLGLGLGKAPLG